MTKPSHETHSVCNKHNIGGESVCCECSSKTDCSNYRTKFGQNVLSKLEPSQTPEASSRVKTVEERAQQAIDIAFERGCTISKGHYDSFKEELTQERHSIHTSLVAAVKGNRLDTSPAEGYNNPDADVYNQALDDTLTIINSIFKE